MKVSKLTSKGQLTVPIEIREALGLDEGSHLVVEQVGDEIRMRKLVTEKPLGDRDPIWDLVGIGASGAGDGAENHDRILADAEIAGWRKSS